MYVSIDHGQHNTDLFGLYFVLNHPIIQIIGIKDNKKIDFIVM